VEEYSREVKKLCQNMLKYMALSLGLKGDVFEKMFGETLQGIRMNYYPPCSRPDLVLGLSPHSDASAITVLQQARGSPVVDLKYSRTKHGCLFCQFEMH